MKKDKELIRLLLLRTESGGEYVEQCEKYDVPTRAYHVKLMKDEGLVEAIVQNDAQGLPHKAKILNMTSKGHDYLDSIRNVSLPPKSGPAEPSKFT